jgi:hypothetical protein
MKFGVTAWGKGSATGVEAFKASQFNMLKTPLKEAGQHNFAPSLAH